MTATTEILNAIPHREPFLMIDEVVEWNEQELLGRKTFTGEEDFFRGHYPHYPIVPGVLLCESALQTGAVFLRKKFASEPAKFEGKIPVVVKMSDIRFRQAVRPGDSVLIRVSLSECMANVYSMSGQVTVNGKSAVKLNFTVMLVDGQ